MVNNMSFAIECVVVEIKSEKSKNLLISCVYRAPATNVDTFKDKLSEMYSSINNKKHVFVCGDFNIDLLNPNGQTQTKTFINSMFCLGLYPSITHPSRITRNTATLIANIFTNVTEGHITGGLLINDITDHLPVFLAHDVDFGIHTELKNMTLVRHVTDNAIESLRRDLMDQVWHEIFVENVDESYDKFISIITNLYNKHYTLVA